MKLVKKIVPAVICAALCVSVSAQDQKVQKASSSSASSSGSSSETSVENEYLNDVDGVVIMSLATSDEYDNKLVALQYLTNAVDNGNNSDEVVNALNQLSGEGIQTQARTNGRIMNNFPDIRRQACLLLGKVKTENSKNQLVKIALADNEPMVIAAAVKSLGDIGINENDEVVDAIAFANRRNEVLNPTSSLALEVLNAFEKLGGSTENKKTMLDAIARIAADNHYVQPVRKRAYEVLKSMNFNDDNSSKKTSSTASSNAK